MIKHLEDIAHAFLAFLATLVPGALGSAIAQLWERGLSWSQRLIQWTAGIIVSHYVSAGVGAWLHLDPSVAQAIGFVIGLIAFRATPAFIAAAVAAAGALPGGLLAKLGLVKGDAA